MTPADEQRLLSMIFNYSWWEWWTSTFFNIGDIGITDKRMDAAEMAAYRRRTHRFPRCVAHGLGDWCERQNRLFHTGWAARPMDEWPRNGRTK